MNSKRDKKIKNGFQGQCQNLLDGCHQDKDCRYCDQYTPIKHKIVCPKGHDPVDCNDGCDEFSSACYHANRDLPAKPPTTGEGDES